MPRTGVRRYLRIRVACGSRSTLPAPRHTRVPCVESHRSRFRQADRGSPYMRTGSRPSRASNEAQRWCRDRPKMRCPPSDRWEDSEELWPYRARILTNLKSVFAITRFGCGYLFILTYWWYKIRLMQSFLGTSQHRGHGASVFVGGYLVAISKFRRNVGEDS